VIQRRENGYVNFYRNWNEYKFGFGELDGDMWLGNELIYQLTKSSAAPKKSELLINMRLTADPRVFYAKHDIFKLGDETSKYLLEVSGPSGNLYPSSGMLSYNNTKFSTRDNDNDKSKVRNCAEEYKGGWWFHNCYEYVYYNSVYKLDEVNKGTIILNVNRRGNFVEMKIRPRL